MIISGGIMGTTRRAFIKDATVVGAAAAVGTTPYEAKSEAEPVKNDSTEEDAGRCPYFDQPLLCKGLAPEGKRLCDE